MTAQQQYDTLKIEERRDLLVKIGETPEEAQLLGQRDYVALGGWLKTRLTRYWNRNKA
jgi:hypothetical protein